MADSRAPSPPPPTTAAVVSTPRPIRAADVVRRVHFDSRSPVADPSGLQPRLGYSPSALVPSVSSSPSATARRAPDSSVRGTTVSSRVGATTERLFVDRTVVVGTAVDDGGCDSLRLGGASTSAGASSIATGAVSAGVSADTRGVSM